MGQEPRKKPRDGWQLLFGLREPVSRGTYLRVGVSLMLLKYAVDATITYLATDSFWSPLDYLSPFVSPGSTGLMAVPTPVLIAQGLWTLPFLWIGLTMTIRRAVDAGHSAWFGLLFLVPFLNYVVMLALCFLPTAPRGEERPSEAPIEQTPALRSALIAVLASWAAMPFFVFSIYSPGEVRRRSVRWAARRGWGHRGLRAQPGLPQIDRDDSRRRHGLAPDCLWKPARLRARRFRLHRHGASGRPPAGARRRADRSWVALMGHTSTYPCAWLVFALVPLSAIEAKLSHPAQFEVASSIAIDAPPSEVWTGVVSFSEIPEPTWPLFRLGIAYPQRARIEGSGVGAVRHCEFSTGAFVEPIISWDEPRRLSFDVIAQPPPMHEWSPYRGVHPPHLDGYFRSQRGEFRLVPLSGQRTRLEGSTWYELELYPTAYWRLWSDLLVTAIHERVLDHIQREVEAEASR